MLARRWIPVSIQPTPKPQKTGHGCLRTAGIGCAGVVGLIILVSAIAGLTGLVSGETPTPGPKAQIALATPTATTARATPTVAPKAATATPLPSTATPVPPTATTAPQATAIPWEMTVQRLTSLKLPASRQVDGYTVWDPAKLLDQKTGTPVLLSGQFYNVNEENGWVVVALDGAESVFGSDPFLVVGQGKPNGQLFSGTEVDVYGIYFDHGIAADRWGLNKDMPIIAAHKIVQTDNPVFSADQQLFR